MNPAVSETQNEKETLQAAGLLFHSVFAESLPVFVLLEGEMGAGKTAFTRGLAEAAGVTETVNSPTFSILNEYRGAECRIFHYDFYRLNEPAEAEDLGFPSHWKIAVKDGLQEIHIIEWWQRAACNLPEKALTYLVKIEIPDYYADRRIITVSKYVQPGTDPRQPDSFT